MPNKLEKSVAVFGGSFNPPTLAHQEIIGHCLNLPGFDEVWLMPSASGYSKKITTSDIERLDMLKIVHQHQFGGDDRLVVSDFELKHPELLETCHTVSALSAEYANADFWYVFGADSYYDMPNWSRGEQLQSGLNMIVFERGGMAPPNRDGIISLGLANYGHLSSTKARLAATNNSGLDGIVSPNIQKYIENNRLYL